MKIRKIALLMLCFVVLYVAAQKIVTLRDEQHSWSFMGWNLKIKGPYIKRSISTTGTRNSDTEFFANDFNVSFQRIPEIEINKSAGAYFTAKGDIRVIEQADKNFLKNLYPTAELDQMFKETEDLNGGIKQFFRIADQDFALLGLKKGACIFGAFVNITKQIEILRLPCLPDPANADLNGLGGGYAFDGEALLLAVGTPETGSTAIGALAQDMSSPYGKVIRFDKANLERPQNGKFDIFSRGHRNPQGLSFIGRNLYLVEHGPKGGDEINLLNKGGNYGWPLMSLGTGYDDRLWYKSAENPKEAQKFEDPVFSFVPSIGISDVTTCPEIVATRYAPLQCLLVSSLRANSIFIVLIELKRRAVASIEKIEFDERIREFVRSDKGETHVLTDAGGLYHVKFDMVVR